MTDSSAAPGRLKSYLRQVVQRSSGIDAQAAGHIQSLTKWLFDLSRNVMILGIIRYFANTYGSWSLRALDVILSGALIAYIYSYIFVWELRPFSFLGKGLTATLLNIVVAGFLSLTLWAAAQILISNAIEEIAKAQGSR